MHDKLRLFVVVVKAVCMAAAGVLVLALATFVLGRGDETALGLLMMLLPIGIASWWMFQKLQVYLARREARAITTAFAMFSPLWFGAAMLLAEFGGGYAEGLFGSRLALLGVFVAMVGVGRVVSFGICLFTLSVTRHIIQLEAPPQ